MKKLKLFLQTYWIDILLTVVVLCVAALPRLLDLGIFLTADEKNWIGRSYEFIRAFKDLRYNDMLQTTHPGVTTLWIAGASITARMILSHIPFSFQNLIHFIWAAQFPIALMNSILVALSYGFLRLLLRKRAIAFFAAFFIALDPFLIGYSRVVHVDALLAGFLFLASLATMLYVKKGFSRTWLVISAVLSGLAMLTKAPGVFMVPFFWLVVISEHTQALLTKKIFLDRLRDFTIWILIIVLLFVFLWPALLWVNNPGGNLLLLKRDLGQAALTPHHMVEDYTLNSYHYPATLLTRTTPLIALVSSIGVGIFLWSVWRKRHGNKVLGLALGFIFFFVVMMTIGAKKGDRYIVPVFPMISLVAALAPSLVIRYSNIRQRIVWYAGMGLIGVSLVATVIVYHPYAIAYSNPFFPDNLSQELGWGEGYDQVASWLNTNAPQARVASWYPEELGAFTSATVVHQNAHEQSNVRYVVLYRNMFGRAVDHPANDFIDEYYKKREPVFVAHVVGKEFAWVYEKRVFERTLGELIAPVRVSQVLDVNPRFPLEGIDLLFATFSGRAKSGTVRITLKSETGTILEEWRIPVNTIHDDEWLKLKLKEPREIESTNVVVDITVEGTRAGDAPTLRYTRDFNYEASTLMFNGKAQNGDAAIRMRYVINGRSVGEEDSKLLLE